MNNEEIKISKERVLKTAEECPESKRALVSLFPELFEEDAVFCNVGDVLVHKDSPYFYDVRLQDNENYYELFNTSCSWAIGVPIKGRRDDKVTVKAFKEIMSACKYKIEDFKVVKAEDVQKLYFNETILKVKKK